MARLAEVAGDDCEPVGAPVNAGRADRLGVRGVGSIFLGCFGFAIGQLLPAQLDDPLLRSIGWLAAGVFALNIAWEYYVPRREIDWGSVAIIVAALAVFLEQPSRAAKAVVAWFSEYRTNVQSSSPSTGASAKAS